MKIKIPKWQINKKNFITISLFLVIIAMENFFYLLPGDSYIVGGIKYSDIGIIMAWLWIIYVAFHFKFRFNKNESIIPALFILIIFLSGVAGDYLLGQSIMFTLRQNRYILTCMVLYYLVLNAMYFGALEKRDLLMLFQYVAVIEIVLFSLQYLLGDSISLLHVTIVTRYGTPRLKINYLFPLIFSYFCLGRLLNGKYKFFNFIGLISGVFIMMEVAKNRMPVLIMLGTFLVAYLLWRSNLSIKFIAGIIMICLIILLYNTTIVQDSINVILYGDKLGTQNTEIREIGRQYYLQKVQQSMLLGFGEPNQNYSPAMVASGAGMNIFLADNGVFGFLYCHGILGIVWLISLFFQMLKKSSYIMLKKRNYSYILYAIYEVLNLYMGMHWYYYYALPFVLFLCLLNYEYYERKEI